MRLCGIWSTETGVSLKRKPLFSCPLHLFTLFFYVLDDILRRPSPSHYQVRPKSTCIVYYPERKTDFLYASPVKRGQKQLAPIQAIPDRTETISYSQQMQVTPNGRAVPSNSRRDKIDFSHKKEFRSGQIWLPPFQAISLRPKPTSSIPSPFSQATTAFLKSKLFPSQTNIVKISFLFSLPCCRCFTNYSVLVLCRT
jgi:hypothetical protein